jgi:hypothetical protein
MPAGCEAVASNFAVSMGQKNCSRKYKKQLTHSWLFNASEMPILGNDLLS